MDVVGIFADEGLLSAIRHLAETGEIVLGLRLATTKFFGAIPVGTQ